MFLGGFEDELRITGTAFDFLTKVRSQLGIVV